MLTLRQMKINNLLTKLKPFCQSFALARHKNTSYHKRKIGKLLEKAVRGPKLMSPPKRRKKFEVGIANTAPKNTLSQDDSVARERLAALGTEYKYDIYSILQTGRYGSELSSLRFAKVQITSDGKEMLVYLEPTGCEYEDMSMVTKLETLIDTIQTEFQKIHPKATLPALKFQRDLPLLTDSDGLFNNLDLGSDEDWEDMLGRKLPPLTFIQDVYGVDRSAMIAKLSSTSSAVTTFGVYELNASDSITSTDS